MSKLDFNRKNPSRRTFLRTVGWGLFALPLVSIFRNAAWAAPSKEAAKKEVALPAGAKEVPAGDAVAKAIGYSKTATGRPAKDAKNNCANCALYAAANPGWGKCTMLTSGLVSADGWCRSWSKKA